MTHRKIVYIAGPLYTPYEREYIDKIASEIESTGAKTFVPHRDAKLAAADEENTSHFFDADLKNMDKAQIVVAILNGSGVDPGTAFEIGYAFSTGKTILGLLEDTRISNPATGINLMIVNSSKIFQSREELTKEVKSVLKAENP